MRHYVIDFDSYESERQYISRSKSVNKMKRTLWFYDNGAVAFNDSSQYTALNKHTNKQWYRWVNTDSASVKRNAHGRLIPTQRTQTGQWYGGGVAATNWYRHAQILLSRYDRGINISDLEDRIPQEDIEALRSLKDEMARPSLIEMVHRQDISAVPAGGFQLIQESNPAALTRRLFGKTRYRKDLVRAVAGKDLTTVMFASNFRGLVPIDWIIGFLRESNFYTGYQFDSNPLRLRYALKVLDRRAYRHLLNDPLDNGKLYSMRDVVRGGGPAQRPAPAPGFERLAGTRPTTWEEMHDLLWPARRNAVIGGTHYNYTPPEPVTIEPTEDALRIHEAFTGTKYSHIMPKDSTELNAWSDEMGNCIRGYDRYAADHRIILGAVLDGGKMIVNYELTNDLVCRQLLGRYNQPLDRTTHDEVVSIMKTAGVQFGDWYAGKPVEGTMTTGQHHQFDFMLPEQQQPVVDIGLPF